VLPPRCTSEATGRTATAFNLNNLFSRFNFEAHIDAIIDDDPASGLTATYTSTTPSGSGCAATKAGSSRARTQDQDPIARRIARMDLDVLAAQEVEDIDTLRFFTAQRLAGGYRFLVLVEGNDPRLIDPAVLAKLPIGAVTSWQHAIQPEDLTE
jgi:hypothetical protein